MDNTNKMIGRVLSVDNFRVFIKIDEDLHGAYKSGFHDIYDVARINSYLVIPVGADRVVALITRVTMKEDIELDKATTGIMLPTASRYISATMLGTITKEKNKEKFIQGVYNFPSLDNPVWYVTEDDLNQIFDVKPQGTTICYESDFYLPIGISPAFSNYVVKICPDQFFVKHAAILGNTGSGKSCTLTSIIRNLFKFEYCGTKLQSAHIVIFDTNGEYKNAFLPETIPPVEASTLKHINAHYYGGEEKVQIPYWFMNWEDFKHFLNPSEGTQAPVLNRAIGLAKNEIQSAVSGTLTPTQKTDIEEIINSSNDELKKKIGISNYGNWIWNVDNGIYHIGESVKLKYEELGSKICELASAENFNNAAKQDPLKEQIKQIYDGILENEQKKQILSEKNIDMPSWFSYHELCTKFIDTAVQLEGKNTSKIAEYLSTLKLRMSSFFNDKRMAIPLMLKDTNEFNKNILPEFIAFILGDFNIHFNQNNESNTAEKHFINTYPQDMQTDKKKCSQITIVDVSQLPFEVLETVAALLGRLILEFVSNFCPEDRGKYPIVLILEEAQNYIAEYKESVAKQVFECIAREGRKYGISLVVCSQRPSELSKTVLSQCNSFIIHRLQNPDDQKYIRGLISSANADILEQLPIIPQQHAIITGDCVRTPVQVRIDTVCPTPNSNNPKYIRSWLNGNSKIPYNDVCDRWLSIKSEKNHINES